MYPRKISAEVWKTWALSEEKPPSMQRQKAKLEERRWRRFCLLCPQPQIKISFFRCPRERGKWRSSVVVRRPANAVLLCKVSPCDFVEAQTIAPETQDSTRRWQKSTVECEVLSHRLMTAVFWSLLSQWELPGRVFTMEGTHKKPKLKMVLKSTQSKTGALKAWKHRTTHLKGSGVWCKAYLEIWCFAYL